MKYYLIHIQSMYPLFFISFKNKGNYYMKCTGALYGIKWSDEIKNTPVCQLIFANTYESISW